MEALPHDLWHFFGERERTKKKVRGLERVLNVLEQLDLLAYFVVAYISMSHYDSKGS